MTIATTKEELLEQISGNKLGTSKITELSQTTLEKLLLDLKDELLVQDDMQRVNEINEVLEGVLVVATNTYYDDGEVIMTDHLFDGQDGPDQMLKSAEAEGAKLFSGLTTNYFQLYIDTFVKLKIEDAVDKHRAEEIMQYIKDPSSLRSDTDNVQLLEEKSKTLPEEYKQYIETGNISLDRVQSLWDIFKVEEEILGELGSSIRKAVNTAEIRADIKIIMEEHQNVIYTPKYDGASGYVTFANKRLESVLQRGKGSRGPNMTIQALAMDRDIPHEIKTSSIDDILEDGDRVQSRGELIIQMIQDKNGKFSEEATLEKLNSNFPLKKDGSFAYNNLRNGVAGLMKKEGLSPRITKEFITYVPFHLYKIDSNNNATKIDETRAQAFFKENGMREVPSIKIEAKSETKKDIDTATDKTMLLYNLTDYVGNNLEIPEDVMNQMVQELGSENVEKIINNPYVTDGAVFNNEGNAGEVDEKTKNIKGYLAAKYSAPTGQSKIIGLITRMNKGNISFRVQIDPIKVGGVIIEYLSGSVAETESIPHFLKMYETGDLIRFKRSGGVIPNLLDPIKYDELIQEILPYLVKSFDELLVSRLIEEKVHHYAVRQLELGLGKTYDSTSGAYWMQFRIALQNKLVEYEGGNQTKFIRNGMNAVLNEVTSNIRSEFSLPNTKDITMVLAEKVFNFKTDQQLVEIKSRINEYLSCPSCSKDMALSETGKQIECANDECEGRRAAAISGYIKLLQVNGANSDTAITTAAKIIGFMKEKYGLQDNEGTIVSDFLRLYDMANDKDIIDEMVAYKELNFAKKSAQSFVKNMNNTVGAREELFIKALNIKNFGETMSKTLFAKIPFKSILNANLANEATYVGIIDKMKEIEGFQEKSSVGFLSFIRKYQDEIMKLVDIVKPKEYEVKTIKVDTDREFVMTVTGATTWAFLKKYSPGQTKKGINYSDMSDEDKGGNGEAKEVLKNQGLVITKGDMVAKVTGGRNPNGKTNFVISDDIADAVSKAAKLKNTVQLTTAEDALKAIEEGKCVLMTTGDFIDSFDAYIVEGNDLKEIEEVVVEKIKGVRHP